MDKDLRTKVSDWLEDLGCTPTSIDDPQTVWHYEFDFPAGRSHRMHAVMPKQRAAAVVIASLVNLSPEHIKAFEEFADDEKAEFLYELRRVLNQVDVEFQLKDADEPLSCPESFQVSAVRYSDGLSLDAFARTVGAVYKTELNAIWHVQQVLGGHGLGPAGRFDFKRLGI